VAERSDCASLAQLPNATIRNNHPMINLPDYKILVPLAVLLGLAPFYPQPHLVEKLGMLLSGQLKRPIDIFDLFWHAWPFFLLAYRLVRDLNKGKNHGKPSVQ
jgi:hypothetical protein